MLHAARAATCCSRHLKCPSLGGLQHDSSATHTSPSTPLHPQYPATLPTALHILADHTSSPCRVVDLDECRGLSSATLGAALAGLPSLETGTEGGLRLQQQPEGALAWFALQGYVTTMALRFGTHSGACQCSWLLPCAATCPAHLLPPCPPTTKAPPRQTAKEHCTKTPPYPPTPCSGAKWHPRGHGRPAALLCLLPPAPAPLAGQLLRADRCRGGLPRKSSARPEGSLPGRLHQGMCSVPAGHPGC